jgi:tetratricopeptide (TPR) repeat protein
VSILELRPDDKRAHYHLAHVRRAQRRLAEAESNLLRYRELDEGSAAATHEVLRFYLATDQSAKAENFLEQAIPAAAPTDRAGLALALVSLLEKTGRAAEGEPFLRQALDADPGRLDVRERWATRLVSAGHVEQALELMADERLPVPPNAEVHRIRGDLLMGAERFGDALAEFRSALDLERDSDVYRLREVEALLRMGEIEASGERIRALLAERPDDPMLALAQIRTLALAARTQEAIESVRQLLARDPKLSEAHFLLGVLQLASDQPAEAARSLEAAALGAKGGDDRELRRLLAEAQLRSGNFTAAAENAERALSADTSHVRTRIVLARAYLESGSPERAEALVREGSAESAGLQATLARLYVKTERLERAEDAVRRAVALEPDSVQWVVDLVWVLTEQGKFDDALEAARTRMLEYPEIAEYPNLVGQVLMRREDYAGADRAFRSAVQVDPGFVPSYVNRARIASLEKRYGDAREVLESALAQQPGNPEALRELGIVEAHQGNTDRAVEAFQAALRADPTSEVTRANLAQAQARAGSDLSGFIEAARMMRQSDPDSPVYAETLGLVLHRSGLPGAAAEQFRDAIANAPHPIAIYHYRLGLALQDAGDRAGATRELERALELDASFKTAEDARRRLAELTP